MQSLSKPVEQNLINTEELNEMRTWIGRRLILKQDHLGFETGTKCQVMCVVDFGNELLLWIITDDQRAQDIDQLDLFSTQEMFKLNLPEIICVKNT